MLQTDGPCFHGKVIRGLQNGRKIGFPTANIALNPAATIATGVYAVTADIEKSHLQGMLYVGTRPTLQLSEKTIEIHLFHFDQELYGKSLSFHICKKIAEEKTFSDLEELKKALLQYQYEIQQYFNE